MSCSTSSNPTDEFYANKGGWDIAIIPIFPPLKGLSTGANMWSIWGIDSPDAYKEIQVLGFGVSGKCVYGTIRKGYTDEFQNYFLYNSKSKAYTDYNSIEELEMEIEGLRLELNPIINCTEYYKNQNCYWYPDKYRNN